LSKTVKKNFFWSRIDQIGNGIFHYCCLRKYLKPDHSSAATDVAATTDVAAAKCIIIMEAIDVSNK